MLICFKITVQRLKLTVFNLFSTYSLLLRESYLEYGRLLNVVTSSWENLNLTVIGKLALPRANPIGKLT